jgi:hypothetical protein
VVVLAVDQVAVVQQVLLAVLVAEVLRPHLEERELADKVIKVENLIWLQDQDALVAQEVAVEQGLLDKMHQI